MNNPLPPKWPLLFFRWYCRRDYLEDLEGDLLERFDQRLQQNKSAHWLFTLDVLRLFRPGLIRGFSIAQKLNQMTLFNNYFKTTLRSAQKEKSFTVLTLLCLTIGFATSLYVGLYTKHELSYDTFHEKVDRIYRINQTFIWGERDELFGSTGPAVMGAIQAEVPEFETMTRVITYNDALITLQSGKQSFTFEEGKLRGADSTFFEVFTFPLLRGNPKTALTEPYSVVMTRSMAEKYYGTIDILGEQLTISDEEHQHSYLVTGVAEDLPSNSHVTFDLLTSMSSVNRLKFQSDTWWWTTFITFGVLRPDADPALVAEKVAQVPAKYLEPFLLRYRGMTYQEFQESGETWELYMQPMREIHLSGKKVFSRLNKTGDLQTILVLNTIGGLILLLSIINFINLTTARSSRRSKEAGIRKIIGTTRSSLISQFLLEAFLFCLVSMALSLVIVQLLSPYFEMITGKVIPLSHLFDPLGISMMIGTLILVTVLAGLYPAFVISAIQPLKVLKGQLASGTQGNFIRKTLVTVQFTISIALIACSLIIERQVSYWMNMDLGFTRDNIIVIQNLERLDQSMNAFKHELRQNPRIQAVSFSSDSPPYIGHSDGDFELSGVEDRTSQISFLTADESFASVYGLQLLAGEAFDSSKNNAQKIMVSRSVVQSFGLTDPTEAIGETLRYHQTSGQIVGVFEDIETEIGWTQFPIAVYFEDYEKVRIENGDDQLSPGPYRELSIHLADGLTPAQVSQLLTDLEANWAQFSPLPIKYYFLDQLYRSLFETSIHFGKLINLYSLIATLIAGLGLMGLVAYVIERRNKEIGIRKVLGASIGQVMVMLTSEFGKLLLIGFVVASAISWIFMKDWQADFPYQQTIHPLTFLWAGLIMLVVALLTLGFQTLKAARSRPVDYLRDE